MAVIVISVIVVALVSDEVASRFRSMIYMPTTAAEWLQNLTMVYANLFPNEVAPRLAPATWALTVELFWYLLISLGLSVSRRVTMGWFAVSLVYAGWCLLTGQPSDYLYFSLLAGSLPFSVGAMIYHFKPQWSGRLTGREGPVLALSMALLVAVIGTRAAVQVLTGEDGFESWSLVLTTVPAALAVASLVQRPWSPLPKRVDVLAGDLSYPLYISHWVVGLGAAVVLGIPQPGLHANGIVLVALSLPLSLLLSWGIVTQIDHRVERMRKRIRAAAEAATA